MTTIPHPTTTVQFDAALRGLAERARTRYAGEAGRLDRGLVIALNGGVSLKADGTALVSSTRDDEVFYIVRDGQCDCPDHGRAPGCRCKHRFAVFLVKRATQQVAQQAVRYFATYTDPAGEAHQGIATQTGQGWLFVSEDGLEPLFASSRSLVFEGRCDIANAKRAEEESAGGLAAIVCGYG